MSFLFTLVQAKNTFEIVEKRKIKPICLVSVIKLKSDGRLHSWQKREKNIYHKGKRKNHRTYKFQQ